MAFDTKILDDLVEELNKEIIRQKAIPPRIKTDLENKFILGKIEGLKFAKSKTLDKQS